MDALRFYQIASIAAGGAVWGRTPEEIIGRYPTMLGGVAVPTMSENTEVMDMTLRQIQERIRRDQDAFDAKAE